MKILIVNNSLIPVQLYGGTQRVIWSLGKELSKLGHEVTFLVKQGSTCNFASVIPIDESKAIVDQIPNHVDVVHFHFAAPGLDRLSIPYIITKHNNSKNQNKLDQNTIFISQNHASRYQSTQFVYNGLDWEEYQKPSLTGNRSYFHFLGKAAWKKKNVEGAIDLIKATPKEHLKVMGGVRFNFKMGMRFTFSPRISFLGMVNNKVKSQTLDLSKGLIFPVRWNEPFGLAIIESMYFGCPVFGTTYGSLPELVPNSMGFLSNKENELAEAIEHSADYAPELCHEYARDQFNSKQMALGYLTHYERVLNKQPINPKPPYLLQLDSKLLTWN